MPPSTVPSLREPQTHRTKHHLVTRSDQHPEHNLCNTSVQETNINFNGEMMVNQVDMINNIEIMKLKEMN